MSNSKNQRNSRSFVWSPEEEVEKLEKENKKLLKKIWENDKEVLAVKKSRESLEEETKKLNKEAEESKKKIARFIDEIERIQVELSQLKSSKENLSKKYDQLMQELSNSNYATSQWKQKCLNQSQELEELKEINQTLNKGIDQLHNVIRENEEMNREHYQSLLEKLELADCLQINPQRISVHLTEDKKTAIVSINDFHAHVAIAEERPVALGAELEAEYRSFLLENKSLVINEKHSPCISPLSTFKSCITRENYLARSPNRYTGTPSRGRILHLKACDCKEGDCHCSRRNAIKTSNCLLDTRVFQFPKISEKKICIEDAQSIDSGEFNAESCQEANGVAHHGYDQKPNGSDQKANVSTKKPKISESEMKEKMELEELTKEKMEVQPFNSEENVVVVERLKDEREERMVNVSYLTRINRCAKTLKKFEKERTKKVRLGFRCSWCK